MRAIFERVHLKRRQVAGLLVFMLLAALAEMLLPTMLAQMIDQGVGDARRSFIITLAVIMAVLALAACVTNAVAAVLAAKISTNFAADIRRELFHKVQDLSAAEMDHFGTASLVTRSTSDVTNLQMFLSMLLRIGVMAPLMAIAGLVLSAATGGRVSSVLNVAIPVLLFSAGFIIILVARYSTKLRNMIDQINKLFLETLEGVRVIRAFNRQEHEMKRFADENELYTRLSIKSSRITGLLTPLIQVIFGVTTAAVMGLGSWYVSRGQMEVGALVANSQYISMILMSIIMLAVVIMMFPMAYACSKRIGEVLKAESMIKDGRVTEPQDGRQGTVEFRDVSFAYPESDEPVLESISFSTHPGEITAIIGRTGDGKSSVLKLIPRLYDPTIGHVLVDGVETRLWNMDALRERIGYVPQKNVLFTGDIASNLNFGAENGGEDDWVRAADIACAREFVEDKDGTYHAAIAQGGSNLSGGQRQRMAIARAVMRRPEIYLFDDSFSALDMKTDRELRGRLKENLGSATVIMVAQRVSSIIDADRIIVLDHGKMAENGTHRELLESCSLYREIAELQLGEEAVRKTLAEGGARA